MHTFLCSKIQGQFFPNFRKFAQRIVSSAASSMQIVSKNSITESECKFAFMYLYIIY